MTDERWHLRITLDSSTKDLLREKAIAERRSVANYIRVLIERDQQRNIGHGNKA